ncbi:hypothetical protein QYM36_009232 [Artemia franciscana]|uniref:EGF-like domain-containing protein n=1 Tax=Artemia franciscana TaxID=6661 RepID=A0AA88HN13_ARTSF|nr:hypothetical protein QYM36_009232 [Artemia franciscana]
MNATLQYAFSSQPSIETNQEIHSRDCGFKKDRWKPLIYGIDMTYDVIDLETRQPFLTNAERGRKNSPSILEPQGNGVTWKLKSRRSGRKYLDFDKSDENDFNEEEIIRKIKRRMRTPTLSRKLRHTQNKLFTIFADFYEEEVIPIIQEDEEESGESQLTGYEPETKSKNFVSINSALNEKEISLALRCSTMILEIPIVTDCAEYLTDFVMKVVNFCVANYHRIMKTSSLPNLIAFLEDHCEAKVVENFHTFATSGTTDWEPPKNIKNALNCPSSCSGHGICLEFGCICDPGFFGDDCAKMTGNVVNSMSFECQEF